MIDEVFRNIHYADNCAGITNLVLSLVLPGTSIVSTKMNIFVVKKPASYRCIICRSSRSTLSATTYVFIGLLNIRMAISRGVVRGV